MVDDARRDIVGTGGERRVAEEPGRASEADAGRSALGATGAKFYGAMAANPGCGRHRDQCPGDFCAGQRPGTADPAADGGIPSEVRPAQRSHQPRRADERDVSLADKRRRAHQSSGPGNPRGRNQFTRPDQCGGTAPGFQPGPIRASAGGVGPGPSRCDASRNRPLFLRNHARGPKSDRID